MRYMFNLIRDTERDMTPAVERYCDLMRQGFMRGSPVPPSSDAELRSAREYADRVLAKLDAHAGLRGQS